MNFHVLKNGVDTHVLELPISITLENALLFYKNRAEVRYALQDFIVRPRLTPCDEGYDNDAFGAVSAPAAWAITTGDRKAGIMAVADRGMNLLVRDMLPNWFINQQEIRSKKTNLTHDIADVDDDELITFIDLNDHILGPNPLMPQNKDLCPSGATGTITCDRDGDGLVTPVDIADGDPSTPTDFENGEDEDGNGKVDDFVGWDFATCPEGDPRADCGDNSPHEPGPTVNECLAHHGTVVASLMAAEGTISSCPGPGIAGLNWSAQLIPIKPVDFPTADFNLASTRSSVYLAFQYASRLNADVLNASFGNTIATIPTCDGSEMVLEQEKFGPLLADLAQEGADVTFGKMLIVAAGENCDQNDDSTQVFDWPVELDAPNIIAAVAARSGAVAVTGAFGKSTFDVVAPLNSKALTGDNQFSLCAGTSTAAPFVSGTIGLMLASPHIPLCVKGNAVAMKNCLLNRMVTNPELVDQVANGKELDTNSAVFELPIPEMQCPCP